MSEHYCYYCGADSADLLELSEAEMKDFDERHPDVARLRRYRKGRPLIDEGCCPYCGFPYEDEDEFEI